MFSLLVVCLVVSSNVASVMSSLIAPNRSVVSIIGERLEMKCRDLSTRWSFTAWNSSTETNIYLGFDIVTSMRSRYRIAKTLSRQHHLIIDSVDLDHAGTYQCTRPMQNSSRMLSHLQLTVLASPPNCSSDTRNADEGIKEHGYLWLLCRIIYIPAGNMTPIFTWTKDNTRNVIVANTTTTLDNLSILFITTSSVLIQVHSDDNGATFKCNITFQLPSNIEVNAPDYEYMWNYTTHFSLPPNYQWTYNTTGCKCYFDTNSTNCACCNTGGCQCPQEHRHQCVQCDHGEQCGKYWPRNISIVRYEDRLECSADGNPTPTYRWTHIETNTVTEGPHLILNTSYDKTYTFTCTAINEVGAENKSVTVPGRYQHSDGTQSVGLIAAVAIGGCLLFLLIVTIIVCVVYMKRRKVHKTVDSDNYCALRKQPTGAEEQQVYCELRSFNEQNTNH